MFILMQLSVCVCGWPRQKSIERCKLNVLLSLDFNVLFTVAIGCVGNGDIAFYNGLTVFSFFFVFLRHLSIKCSSKYISNSFV